MHKSIGIIGLGKMGSVLAERLAKKGWQVTGFDQNPNTSRIRGVKRAHAAHEALLSLSSPRVLLLMVPAHAVVEALEELSPHLNKGDVVIDGGNSFYKDSMHREKSLASRGISFLDAGISGGPVSIKMGRFAIMVGGDKKAYQKVKSVFRDLSDTPSGYMGTSGAGHFAKMIHNGIEYGMMQSLAEGFTLLKHSPFKFKLSDVANVYNSNSIITSRLVGWMEEGLRTYGEGLEKASGSVAHTGEGEWTVKTAKELKVPVPVIERSFRFRVESQAKPSYTGKILSMLRAVFGGHEIGEKKKA